MYVYVRSIDVYFFFVFLVSYMIIPLFINSIKKYLHI
jgi:hypothetical protein